MQPIDSIETYSYGTSENLVSEKEEIKCSIHNKTIQKMTNFDNVTKESIKQHNPNWQKCS